MQYLLQSQLVGFAIKATREEMFRNRARAMVGSLKWSVTFLHVLYVLGPVTC